MSAESTYLQEIDTIKRIAAFVARRAHVNADESEEFVQVACVRLWENDYSIIGKFEGRSSFTTYLTTVILRLFHQWRVEQWGKWRPSAEAKRLGDKAIVLERLLTRDGYTFAEAVKILTTRSGAEYSVEELEMLYVRLPVRTPRPMFVSEEVSPDALAVDGDAEERVAMSDREQSARQATEVMERVLLTLEADDRVILQMRFWDSRKVPDIARMLHLDQKKVYKRLDKLFAILRRALEGAGISKSEVESLLGRGDQDIRLGILSDRENASFRPSNPTDGKESRGGGGGPQ
jgi:RNA polymerase sigma factor (sigma-70 family)